jgi:hypothetical protein
MQLLPNSLEHDTVVVHAADSSRGNGPKTCGQLRLADVHDQHDWITYLVASIQSTELSKTFRA